jgi:hypothetical protein
MDSEGSGNMQKSNLESFYIEGTHHEGETLYVAIYTLAKHAKVCLSYSFEHESAIRILNAHLGRDHDDGPIITKKTTRLFEPRLNKNAQTLRTFKRDYQDQVSTMVHDKSKFKKFRQQVKEYKGELQQLQDKQQNNDRWKKLKE